MDFDALHDPHPPTPGSHELAAVAHRARQIRRRRRALSGTGAVVALAAVTGLVVLQGPDSTPTLRPDSTLDMTPETTGPLLTPDTTVSTTANVPRNPGPCDDLPLALPWMPDGSTPGQPVMQRIDPGDDGLVYAQTWVDSTGDVTLWTDRDFMPAPEAIGAAIAVQPGGVAAGTYAGPSVYTAMLSPTANGALLQVVREGGCSLWFEFGGSAGSNGTTLSVDTLVPLVADWLDAWNLFAAVTVSRSETAMCFRFDTISPEQCIPLAPGTDTPAAPDPVVLALGDVQIGDLPVRLVAGLVTDAALAPSPMFPLGGVDELAAGDPRRFVWGLVSPRLCDTGVVSSALFLSAVCSLDTSGPDDPGTTVDPVIPADRIGMTVGIDANGDAVLLRPNGTVTVLFDGTAPGTVATEGDLAFVDHVSLSSDGTRAVVSTCCEPMSGSFHVIDTSTLEQVGGGLGHLAEYTSSGSIVVASGDGISLVGGTSFGLLTYLWEMPVDGPYAVVDLAVIGDSVYAITEAIDPSSGALPVGFDLHRFTTGGGDMHLTVEFERTGVPPSHTISQRPRLVGATVWLFLTDSWGALRAFDLDTLAESDATGQFGQTPLWVGNQVFTVTTSGNSTTLGFEDTLVNFPGTRLTFARF